MAGRRSRSRARRSAPAPAPRGGARELAWVRLMRARVPAFDALEPGDLGIVPVSALAIVAPDDEAVATLIRAAADAGIGGIVLVEDPLGPTPSGTIAAVAGAANAVGLAVLAAGPGDPAQVERSAIGFLVNHRAELERQATILESRLEQVALAGGGPEEMAAAIAGFLGRAVAIEGRRGTRLAVHAPAGVPDAAAAVAAYHHRRRSRGRPDPAAAAAARRPRVPAGDEPADASGCPGPARRATADRARARRDGTGRRPARPRAGPGGGGRAGDRHRAPRAAAGRRSAVGRPRGAAVDRRGRRLRSRRPAGRRTVRRREPRGAPPRPAGARPGPPDGAPRRRPEPRAPARSSPPRRTIREAMDLARRIAAFLGRLVAVSRPFAEARDRSAAEAEARATLEAAERLAEPPAVARADRLPAYRLLGNLHNLPDGERQARALLEPLLRGRAGRPPRAAGDAPRRPRAAGHRRGGRCARRPPQHASPIGSGAIEAATGWRLADPELRFPLALALRLVQDA